MAGADGFPPTSCFHQGPHTPTNTTTTTTNTTINNTNTTNNSTSFFFSFFFYSWMNENDIGNLSFDITSIDRVNFKDTDGGDFAGFPKNTRVSLKIDPVGSFLIVQHSF